MRTERQTDNNKRLVHDSVNHPTATLLFPWASNGGHRGAMTLPIPIESGRAARSGQASGSCLRETAGRDCDRGDDVVASSACGRGYGEAGLRPGHCEVASSLRFGFADSAFTSFRDDRTTALGTPM